MLQAGSQGFVNQQGNTVGDLGEPFADIANLSYVAVNGSLFFRFTLRGNIPNQIKPHVSGIWYQVLFDVDSDSHTGYHWSSNFTPDYMLDFEIGYNASTGSVEVDAYLSQHCGSSSDWCWDSVGFTQHYGTTPLIAGGIGKSFFVLTCDHQDIMATHGSVVTFFGRSGIMYDNNVYNYYVPSEGFVHITL
ncbi:MAG: hypothetical protein ACLP5V_11860 [Candidatus Bathyarchaeia archaeon]